MGGWCQGERALCIGHDLQATPEAEVDAATWWSIAHRDRSGVQHQLQGQYWAWDGEDGAPKTHPVLHYSGLLPDGVSGGWEQKAGKDWEGTSGCAWRWPAARPLPLQRGSKEDVQPRHQRGKQHLARVLGAVPRPRAASHTVLQALKTTRRRSGQGPGRSALIIGRYTVK